MKTIQLLYLAIFSLCLLAYTENPENKAQYPAPVVHHEKKQNNEQMQDIYSQYIRTNRVDWVIFNSEEIRKTLDKQTIPDGLYGKIYIDKTERYKSSYDNFTSEEEFIKYKYYKSKFSDKPCTEKNVQGLVCIKDRLSYNYYYLANAHHSRTKKINFSSFSFHCGATDSNCRMLNILASEPHNINISIHFHHPEHIFLILEYINQHFYNSVGVYLWQPVPKQNK